MASAVRRGFNGFVVYVDGEATEELQSKRVHDLLADYPDKEIFLEGDFVHLRSVWADVDGIFSTGIFNRVERRSGNLLPLHPLESLPLQKALVVARKAGLKTLVMDFGDPTHPPAVAETASSIRDMGAIPFISNNVRGGVIVGPWHERARTVVVVHGWNPEHLGGRRSDAKQTHSAEHLHAPLEWLGYRVRYVDIGSGTLPLKAEGLAGVVMDQSLLLTKKEQAALAEWVSGLVWEKVPLLLTGQPWSDPEVFDSLRKSLEMGGTGAEIAGIRRASVAALDSEFALSESSAKQSVLDFLDLQAPDQARVVLSVRGDAGLRSVRFDQAFLAPWGAGLFHITDQMDVAAILEEWLSGQSAMPVPDTTTREGRRLVMLQTGSEGFAATASEPGLPICGELMKTRVLDRYLLPFTVGLCEAEIRGWLPGLNAVDAPRFEQAARQIFALPQVEPASATFTRSMAFGSPSEDAGQLNAEATDDRRGMEREIAGSLAHLHRTVLPVGKSLGFVQWPDSFQPTAEAVSFARRMGAASLVSDAKGSGTRTFVDGGVTVVHHATLGLETPTADFREDPELPRRMPLALGFEFDDARDASRFEALEERLDLCASQPLQPIRSRAFAELAEDAERTRIFEEGPGHWIVLNSGHARSFRLPVSAGVPDLRASRGVTGYKVRGQHVYVHTLGRRSAEIVMTAATEEREHLRLEESGAALRFHLLASREAEFEFQDLRSGDLVFAGMIPESVCRIRVNDQRWTVLADANGRVRLELPPSGYAHLQVLPPAYAATR